MKTLTAVKTKDKANKKLPAENPHIFSNRCTIQCGFFSVPFWNSSTDSNEKIIRLVNYADETATRYVNIEAFPRFGLPTTTDLTLYLAFQKILDENYKYLRSADETVYFSAYELLGKINLSDGEENFKRVRLWGERMKETSIRFFEEEKRAKTRGTFNVFQEFITRGTEADDGSISDQYRVRLSAWELGNRLDKPLLPLDFATYLRIKDKKAQLLIPHLQVWLYASQNTNVFRKNYRELCALLGLKPYADNMPGAAQRQFRKSFEVLKNEKYIERAKIYKARSNGELIVEFVHGEKFFRDMKIFILLSNTNESEGVSTPDADRSTADAPGAQAEKLDAVSNRNETQEAATAEPKLLAELVNAGLNKPSALKIISQRTAADIELIMRHCKNKFAAAPGKYKNESGYLFTLLKDSEFRIPDDSGFDNDSERKESRTGLREKSEEKHISGETGNLSDEEDRTKYKREKYEEFLQSRLKKIRKNFKPDYKTFERTFETKREVFEKFTVEIKKTLDVKIFEAWFGTITYAGYDCQSHELLLAASSTAVEWIGAHYGQIVEDAARRAADDAEASVKWIRTEFGAPEIFDSAESSFNLLLREEFLAQQGITFDEFCETERLRLDRDFENIRSEIA